MKRTVLLITSALSSGMAAAVPAVIYDSGQTHPIAPYLKALKASTDKLPKQVPSRFPITTPELSVGVVNPRNINQPALGRPLFLIGSDENSERWLVRNKEHLKKIQAAGMLVQADNQTDVDTIKALAAGLDMVAAPASSLAKHLNLKHYPVLISKNRVEQ